MALAADSSVGKRALLAKEWISQSSASQQQQQSSLSCMKKSGSRSKEGVVSPERANESVLFAGMNLAHVGSVEVVLQALDIPVGTDNEKEDGIPPLSSTLIKSKSSRSTSSTVSGRRSAHLGSLEVDLQALDVLMCSHNQNWEDEIPPLSSTLIKSKSSRSTSSSLSGRSSAHLGSLEVDLQALDVPMCSHNQNREDGLPPLSSTLIKAKSSRSTSSSVSGRSSAHLGPLEAGLQALDMPMCSHYQNREDEFPPLSSTLSKSKSSRSTSSSLSGRSSAHLGTLEVGLRALDMPLCTHNQNREDGFPPLTPTVSPLIKSKSSKSSSNQGKRDEGIPPLTSTCSPLITSNSSKSSSNQGSLQGLVVAPDGVTLVKDRRKCKPRGVLTVGLETSSVSSDGEVALPVPSPSMATVEWVDKRWNDALSPQQSHPDELNLSCSTVTSKSVRSPRVALNFDCTKELRVRDVWSNIREVVDLRPEIVLSIQESNDLKKSVEGRSPADLIFVDSYVSFRPPELANELLSSGKDYSVSTSSIKQQHHRSTQEISPEKQMVFSDTDHYHDLDVRQSLQLELQDDVNGSSSVEISERPSDYGSDMNPLKHSETRHLTVERAETHLGGSNKNGSELGSFCPLSVSPSLLGSPGNEDADVPLGCLIDLACARGSPIVMHKHGERFEIRGSELSQLSPEELVAETLYELAAENLRKTRTAARTFNSPEEKKSPMEAASLLSIVKQPVFPADTSSSGELATLTNAVPHALNSRIFRQVSPTPELAKLDIEQPRRTIVLSRESHFSEELTTLKALIGNVHEEAHDTQVRGLPATIRGVHEEAQGPAESSLPFSKKPQRQRRRLSYGYYTNSRSPIRKAQQQQQRRLSSCGKGAGLGSILAATAAFAVVVISLAMGSCQQCYKSNHYHYYIRPT